MYSHICSTKLQTHSQYLSESSVFYVDVCESALKLCAQVSNREYNEINFARRLENY
jgi:hypothetical protein